MLLIKSATIDDFDTHWPISSGLLDPLLRKKKKNPYFEPAVGLWIAVPKADIKCRSNSPNR